jgi:hypothetical protein
MSIVFLMEVLTATSDCDGGISGLFVVLVMALITVVRNFMIASMTVMSVVSMMTLRTVMSGSR